MPEVVFVVDKEADKRMCKHFIEGLKLGSLTVEEYVEKEYAQNIDVISKSRDELAESWNDINDKVLERLSEIMQIEWPQRNAKGIMTVNVICPRDIHNWTFYISYFLDISSRKSIVLHELTHFLFFEKWKQVFPECNEREFDAPYLPWELSEILVEPIDLDEELVKLVPPGHKTKAYKRYYTLKTAGGETVIEHFSKIYNDYKDDFGGMLKRAYAEIKKLDLPKFTGF